MKYYSFFILLSLTLACLVNPVLAEEKLHSEFTDSTAGVEYQSPISDYKHNNDAQRASWQDLNKEVATKALSMEGMAGMDMSSNQVNPEKAGNLDSMKGMDMEKPKTSPHIDHSMQDMEQNHQQPASAATHDVPPAGAKMDHSQMTANSSMGQGVKEDANSIGETSAEEEHDHSGKEAMNKANDSPSESDPVTIELIPNFHPIAVHFPIALLLISFLVSMSARLSDSPTAIAQMAVVGHWTLWLAALSGLIAVAFGLQAYNSVNHDEAGHAAMLIHRNWAIPTATGIALFAMFDAWKSTSDRVMRWPSLLILGILALAVVTTGWLGGEVVYRHGIGVMSLPESEEAITGGHDHGHQQEAKDLSTQSGHHH